MGTSCRPCPRVSDTQGGDVTSYRPPHKSLSCSCSGSEPAAIPALHFLAACYDGLGIGIRSPSCFTQYQLVLRSMLVGSTIVWYQYTYSLTHHLPITLMRTVIRCFSLGHCFMFVCAVEPHSSFPSNAHKCNMRSVALAHDSSCGVQMMTWYCSSRIRHHCTVSDAHVAVDNAVSPEGDASSEGLWLPTYCLHLLQRICKARPNHLLIAADFDELPDVAVPGHGAPLVASMVCLTSA